MRINKLLFTRFIESFPRYEQFHQLFKADEIAEVSDSKAGSWFTKAIKKAPREAEGLI